MSIEKRTRRYGWGKLTLSADLAQAAARVYCGTDGDETVEPAPFSTSDVSHSWTKAFTLVNGWLATHAG